LASRVWGDFATENKGVVHLHVVIVIDEGLASVNPCTRPYHFSVAVIRSGYGPVTGVGTGVMNGVRSFRPSLPCNPEAERLRPE